ncbi:hypothetical protein ACROAE_06195 [Shewanella sp. MF05960]|uniref:hypothetical protein n=1 Tax=Shewanella sp. MF05960 TaxID=3434874 RepID=UPI003D78F55C
MNLEDKVKQFFTEFGLTARKIPESHEKSPDFEIKDDLSILVEVKEKLDDEELKKKIDSSLSQSGLYEGSETFEGQRRYKSIFKHAVKQLQIQKEKTNSDLCFIFIVMSGHSQKSQREQTFASLYGARSIVPNGGIAKHCLYMTFSDFFKYKDTLDGVFIIYNGIINLLINDKSPNYATAINSAFVNKFQKFLFDPTKQEREGYVYYCDSEIPRANENELQDYVFNKYEIPERSFVHYFENHIVHSVVE